MKFLVLMLLAFFAAFSAFSADRPVLPVRVPPVVLKPIVLKPEYSRLVFVNRAKYHLENSKLSRYFGDEGNHSLLVSDLKPETLQKFLILKNEINKYQTQFNPNTLKDVIDSYMDLGDADIDALVQLIMMEIAKDTAADMKDMLKEMQQTNKKKAATREALDNMKQQLTNCLSNPNCRVMGANLLRQKVKDLEATKDSLSELGEEQQLKMQMIMDRMARAQQMLSNLLKKLSETANSIISNIK